MRSRERRINGFMHQSDKQKTALPPPLHMRYRRNQSEIKPCTGQTLGFFCSAMRTGQQNGLSPTRSRQSCALSLRHSVARLMPRISQARR